MSDPSAAPIIDLSGLGAADSYVDPTDDELAAADRDEALPGTPLEELEAELAADLAGSPIRLEVDGRPGYVAVYRRDFTGPDIDRWRKAAKKGRDDVDGIKFAGLVVTRTLIRLEKNGAAVYDPEATDTLLTFSSPYMQRIQQVNSAIDAARRFFGGDGYLDAQASTLVNLAGWGEAATSADDPS